MACLDYDYTNYMNDDEFDEWLLRRLSKAFVKARKGKRATVDEHKFEVCLVENLTRLRDAISAGYYKPGRGIAFVTHRPVPREIFAAPFKDRVVHHFLFDIVYDWWDARLVYDAYSCRVGKGVTFGIGRMQKHIQNVSEGYQKKAYVIKMDVQGYFMSLPRDGLMERIKWGLDQQFPKKGRLYEIMNQLWAAVIFDDPCDGVTIKGNEKNWECLPKSKSLFCQPPGQGIVIGNLSSQLLSNIYLDQLDRFVMYSLKYRHYGRYVDDFYIVVTEEELPQARRDIAAIREYLATLKLTLHPKKTVVQEVHRGVPFLGVMIHPWGVVPARRYKSFFREAAFSFARDEADVASIISYLGHAKPYKNRAFEKRLFDALGWRYRF